MSEMKYLEVYAIRKIQGKEQKSRWTRIGTGFENKDGSFNLRLEALPVTNPETGTADLHMRLPKPKDDSAEHDSLSWDNGVDI